MINQSLHKKPAALDREQHRKLKLDRQRLVDFASAEKMNSCFVNAVEFGDVCREYPIVFVNAGENPDTKKIEVAPVAVFGLVPEENLFVGGGRWNADYVPAHLRIYPFAIARANDQQYAIVLDESCAALNETTGEALFDDKGEPTEYLKEVQKFLESIELELQRTRAMCQRLVALDLLQDMRFDATLPDGNTLTVDGFLALDEKKLNELPDATVVELYRSGIMGLIHAQQVSMGNMRRLLERRLARNANA